MTRSDTVTIRIPVRRYTPPRGNVSRTIYHKLTLLFLRFGTKYFSGRKCRKQLRKNPSGASIVQRDLAPDRPLVGTHQRCIQASQRPSKNRWSEERKEPRNDTSISSLRRSMLACELIHLILRPTRHSSGSENDWHSMRKHSYKVARMTKNLLTLSNNRRSQTKVELEK